MARPTLLDHRGNPITRSALKAEIAGPTLTGVRSPITGYPGDGLNPNRLTALLREADEGEPLRYLELAEQIEERDLHYAGVLATRKRSVAQLEITVDAASDDPAAIIHADMVRDWLLRDELADELFDVLDAIGKGWSATEIIWDSSQGQWRPDRLEWRDPRWFRFDRADGTTPMLRTEAGDAPVPGFKFIFARIRAKSGLPMRSGLARLATWSWMFKAFTLRDWAIFTQTFGQPIRVGKYGAGATEEDKDTLFRAVANIAGDCAAIIPESMLIEFVEAKAPGQNVKIYEERANWLDRQVSKAVLGQTATTDAIAGGHAVGREHRQVQEDIERADCRSLGAILNRDLVRPWIDLEFGPQERYPRLRIGREEERDLALTVDAVTKLVPYGLKVAASEFNSMLGLAEPDEDAALLSFTSRSDVPSSSALDPSRSEPRSSSALDTSRSEPRSSSPLDEDDPDQKTEMQQQEARRTAGPTGNAKNQARRTTRPTGNAKTGDPVDHLADAADRIAGPAADALIDTVRKLVETADSLEEVRDRLLDLRPEMPAGDLAGLMRQALVFAELSGRDESSQSRA